MQPLSTSSSKLILAITQANLTFIVEIWPRQLRNCHTVLSWRNKEFLFASFQKKRGAAGPRVVGSARACVREPPSSSPFQARRASSRRPCRRRRLQQPPAAWRCEAPQRPRTGGADAPILLAQSASKTHIMELEKCSFQVCVTEIFFCCVSVNSSSVFNLLRRAGNEFP